ncbi:hypothetical protein [Muriicola soli]|uniref:hypothetical protein n=1 Tax=Muriicola soli TaxID=2507538 RepID=UPI0013EBEF83|nr:hypothetical protein [Muriicola soli]
MRIHFGFFRNRTDALFTCLNFIFLAALLCSGMRMSAQSVGDYRSVGSGNWSNPAVW